MMQRVNLHAHCYNGSFDSLMHPVHMREYYDSKGYGVCALVGHNRRVDEQGFQTGVEHSVKFGNSTAHVVELPELDFRFLAHPAKTWRKNTKEKAEMFIRKHRINGVEKYNNGMAQYDGHIDYPGVVELANDDAHNTLEIGTSYMKVDSDGSPRAVINAIRRGEHELVNRSVSLTGRALKAATYAYGCHTGRDGTP